MVDQLITIVKITVNHLENGMNVAVIAGWQCALLFVVDGTVHYIDDDGDNEVSELRVGLSTCLYR